MHHRVIGYSNVTTRKIIIHLYAKYSNITVGSLKDKKQIMKTAYNSNQTIKALYMHAT